ncbi:hypothetical protein ACLOJK_022818 [Asimina triloba]
MHQSKPFGTSLAVKSSSRGDDQRLASPTVADFLLLKRILRYIRDFYTSLPLSSSLSSVSFFQLKGTDLELYTEEKIWEQIGAVRTIVGYNATVHASYVEELKALYLFTGVEPPASFKDPSDLAQASHKLHFLKSVIGVK